MSKRTVFTTITPLPDNITREVVVEFLHNHLEMIDLNPLVKERHPVKPPPHATPEEFHCIWYSLTDKISYLPGGLVTGDVSYSCAFHDLPLGLQTHCYAPMGLDIRDKWTVGGSLPGEPVAPVELGIGAPITGLYLREDIDMRCNLFMTSFVKRTLKRAHASLVDRLKVKAQIATAADGNMRLAQQQMFGVPPVDPAVAQPRPWSPASSDAAQTVSTNSSFDGSAFQQQQQQQHRGAMPPPLGSPPMYAPPSWGALQQNASFQSVGGGPPSPAFDTGGRASPAHSATPVPPPGGSRRISWQVLRPQSSVSSRQSRQSVVSTVSDPASGSNNTASDATQQGGPCPASVAAYHHYQQQQPHVPPALQPGAAQHYQNQSWHAAPPQAFAAHAGQKGSAYPPHPGAKAVEVDANPHSSTPMIAELE